MQRPKFENQEVTLTATIRYGLGKDEADFSFNVIKTDHVPRSEVYVLTKEEVASGEATHHLFVGFEDEDEENIFSVYGNFGQTKVTSMEDALYVMELYRPLFDLDESHQFVAEDVLPGNGTKTYKLRQITVRRTAAANISARNVATAPIAEALIFWALMKMRLMLPIQTAF